MAFHHHDERDPMDPTTYAEPDAMAPPCFPGAGVPGVRNLGRTRRGWPVARGLSRGDAVNVARVTALQ